MKIKNVVPFLVGPEPSSDGWSPGQIVIFVKLETECGLVGWGEAYMLTHRHIGICETIRALGAALSQMQDATPRGFLRHVVSPMRSKHPSIDYDAAASGIELALWDLMGKKLDQPLHRLLGGAITERVPIYANAWDSTVQTPQAVADRCAMMCAQGYRAVKIYPLRRSTLDEAEACVRLTREAVGPDVDLLLDFAVQTDPVYARRAIERFARYDPYWIEEPVAGDALSSMAELRAQTGARVVTGERQSDLRHYRDVLVQRAADTLNPDIASVGVVRMLEIGALADAHGAQISPHSWNSTTVAFMAMLHVFAVMPNATYAELYYDYLELGAKIATCDYKMEDGAALLPRSPGLGVTMNEEAIRARAPHP